MRAPFCARIRFVRVACIAFALLGNGCGGDSSGPAPAEVEGTWNATSMTYSRPSGSESVDLIAQGGSAVLILGAGTYQFTVTPAAGSEVTETGTWRVSSDVMTFTPAGMPFSRQFDCVLSGDSLELRGADAEWDFDGDSTPDPAKLDLELVRVSV